VSYSVVQTSSSFIEPKKRSMIPFCSGEPIIVGRLVMVSVRSSAW